MFYSHEVLTSSKYGVATVWLVATLGSDSARRKVNRSEILNVNVPKACETITNSDTPLALRLQSNLLYGVSKVYSQQCTFVMNDAEHVRTQVRAAMQVLRTSEATAHKSYVAKRNQITAVECDAPEYADDDDFIPGLSDLRLNDQHESFLHDSLFTVESLHDQLSQSLHSDIDELTQQLIIPSDDISAGGINLPTYSPGDLSALSRSYNSDSLRLGSNLFAGLEGSILDDVGLDVDAEGNIVDTTALAPQADEDPAVVLETALDDYFLPGEERHLELLGQAKEFSPRGPLVSSELTPVPISIEEPSSPVATAANRVIRKLRALKLDASMELSTAELGASYRNYQANMLRASTARFHRGGITLAKENAHFWVFGNLHTAMSAESSAVPQHLHFCTGGGLLDALAAVTQPNGIGSKRVSDAGDHEERHVRPRLSASEAVRSEPENSQLPEDDFVMQDDPSLELGREPGTPLAEHRSSTAAAMPWNVRSSTRGSSVPRHFSIGAPGMSSSVAGGRGAGSADANRQSIAASPLAGREVVADETMHVPGMDDEDVLMGDVHASVSQVPSWLAQTQDPDAVNFLGFIREAVADGDAHEVTFESLLPPTEHTSVVAAHGLMHVLSLTGRHVLKVLQAQDEAFRPIRILLR